ncbi:kinetochore-associated protein DSN1 homolog isoform 2-T2 [Spinachia spinachia]
MAEKHSEASQDGNVAADDNVNATWNTVDSVKQSTKRCSTTSPSTPPSNKSPRTVFLPTSAMTPAAVEGQSGTDHLKMGTENQEGPSSPTDHPSTRRKSWRRATITRRSLPALVNPYRVLCRSISTSLSQQERLEELMEASMKLAIERTQSALQSVPNTSLESFQKQVVHMQKEWSCLAKSIRDEPEGHQLPATTASSSDPVLQEAMEKVKKALNRFQAESESWEALLIKHRSRAEELESKLERGKKGGVSVDSSLVAQSSQYRFIQSKPDYQGLLCRQQPMLHTIAMIMDTESKMVRELLSIKEQSQLLVKKTSGRLAAEAGFQDLPPDPIRNLIAAPLSSATIVPLAGCKHKQSII